MAQTGNMLVFWVAIVFFLPVPSQGKFYHFASYYYRLVVFGLALSIHLLQVYINQQTMTNPPNILGEEYPHCKQLP